MAVAEAIEPEISEISIAKGVPLAIGAALDRALQLIEETGANVYRPHVHEERAELARLRGDTAARERELREAHRDYTKKGATGDEERVGSDLADRGSDERAG